MNTEQKKLDYLQEGDLFYTHDLGLSAALRSRGCHFLGMDKTNPKKASFIFEKDDEIEGLVGEYFRGVLQVDALSLVTHMKLLKQELYV